MSLPPSNVSLLAMAEEMAVMARDQQDTLDWQAQTISRLQHQLTVLAQENAILKGLLDSSTVAAATAGLETPPSTSNGNGHSRPTGIAEHRAESPRQSLARGDSASKRSKSRNTVKSPASAPQWSSSSLPNNGVRTPGAGTESEIPDTAWYDDGRVKDSDGDVVCHVAVTTKDNAVSATSSSAATVGESSDDSPRKTRRRRTSRSFDDHDLVQRMEIVYRNTSQPLMPMVSSHEFELGSRHVRKATAGASSYQTASGISLSFDIEEKMQERTLLSISRHFGHPVKRCQQAAVIIQTQYRAYCLARRVRELRRARRSGTFRRPSDCNDAFNSQMLSANLAHFAALHARAIGMSDNTPSITEEDDEAFAREAGAVTQSFQVEEPQNREAESPPGSYSGDASSADSSLLAGQSIDCLLIATDRAVAAYGGSSQVFQQDPKVLENLGRRSLPPQGGESEGGKGQRRRSGSDAKVKTTRDSNVVVFDVHPMAAGTEESKVRKQRKLRIGITYFNRKASKGVAYLISHDLLGPNPRDIAVFLKKQGGLSRKMIGEYLGQISDALCQAVLREFVSMFTFEGQGFVQALRKFLASFQIPGEAQKIESILEIFANRFCSCNEKGNAPLNPDTYFILAFSTIMLNTDLHNASVKKHMTKQEFIRNNRGIDSGKDLPVAVLTSIYDDIEQMAFANPKDHVSQVLSLQKSILGNCPPLALTHRQLVHVARMFEVPDRTRKQPPNAHSRFVFLFNDLLLVAKFAPKKSLNTTYVYKGSFLLNNVWVEEFSNNFYKHGLILRNSFDDKVLACYNGEKEAVTKKFTCDLKEVLQEISEMEQERLSEMDGMSRRGSKKTQISPDVMRRMPNGGRRADVANGTGDDEKAARSMTMPASTSKTFFSLSADQGGSRDKAGGPVSRIPSLRKKKQKTRQTAEMVFAGN